MVKSFLSISANKGVKFGPIDLALFENSLVWPVDPEKSVKTPMRCWSRYLRYFLHYIHTPITWNQLKFSQKQCFLGVPAAILLLVAAPDGNRPRQITPVYSLWIEVIGERSPICEDCHALHMQLCSLWYMGGGSHSVHCSRPTKRMRSALRKFSVGSLKILRASMHIK